MLFRRRWIILGVFVLALAIAGFMAYESMQERVYQTTSIVMADVGRIPRAVPSQATDPGEDLFATPGNTIADEIYVLSMSKPLVQKAGEIIKTRIEQQGGEPDYPIVLGEQTLQDLTPEQIGGRARRLVTFVPAVEARNIIQIQAVGPSAPEVTLTANAFAQAYEQITQKVSLSKVSRSEETLQEMVQNRRAALDTMQAQRLAYLSANPTASLGADGAALTQQVMALEAQQSDTERVLAELTSTLSSLEDERTAARRNLGDRSVARLREERDLAKTRLDNVIAAREVKYRAFPQMRTNPEQGRPQDVAELRELNRQYEQLQPTVERLEREYAAALNAAGGITDAEQGAANLRALEQRINETRRQASAQQASLGSIRRDLQFYRSQLNSLPGQQSRLADIELELRLREQEYNEAVRAVQGTYLQQSTEGGYVQVIQQASFPTQPLPSGAMQTLLLGGFLGLLLGGGLAMIFELSSNRLYKQEDIEKLNVNVLDFLPHSDLLEAKNKKKRITVGSRDVSAAVVALFSPYGPYVEALRKLETSIQFAVPKGKTFLITSSTPGEGKSVTTANLAVLFARSGKRTLLIDGDLRRPQVHTYFGIENEIGLANALSPSTPVSAAGAMVDLGVENLRILPAGSSSRISTELLQSDRFAEVLDEVRAHFDIILIDSPPVLAISDAEVMSRQVDGTLVICRAGMTKAGELTTALESLRRARANVVGAVLNGFKITMAYGYRYRYGKYAGKGYYGYGYNLTAPKENA